MAYATETKVFIDSYELLDSRTINVFDKEFEIHISNLRIHFKFISDRSKPSGDIEPEPINDKEIAIELYNFSNAPIGGYFDPLEIGRLNNRRLYINFTLCTANESRNAHALTYNIFLGESIND
jgi:hypothetical protein